MLGLILKLAGVSVRPARQELMEYAARLPLVVVQPAI
jgi:hypothetical protein